METKVTQNTTAWKMARLGRWNGSELHQLMKAGRKKDEFFGDTARTYIYEVASQRNLLPKYRENEDCFMEYDELNFGGNKFTDYGHLHEEEAAQACRFYLDGVLDIRECGSFTHDTIPNLAASPDRIMTMTDGEAVLEIKCPQPKTWLKYLAEISDAATLLAVKPEYYYQLHAEMMCTGLNVAYICFYSHFEQGGIHVVRVTLEEATAAAIKGRIEAAENIINNLLNL